MRLCSSSSLFCPKLRWSSLQQNLLSLGVLIAATTHSTWPRRWRIISDRAWAACVLLRSYDPTAYEGDVWTDGRAMCAIGWYIMRHGSIFISCWEIHTGLPSMFSNHPIWIRTRGESEHISTPTKGACIHHTYHWYNVLVIRCIIALESAATKNGSARLFLAQMLWRTRESRGSSEQHPRSVSSREDSVESQDSYSSVWVSFASDSYALALLLSPSCSWSLDSCLSSLPSCFVFEVEHWEPCEGKRHLRPVLWSSESSGIFPVQFFGLRHRDATSNASPSLKASSKLLSVRAK